MVKFLKLKIDKDHFIAIVYRIMRAGKSEGHSDAKIAYDVYCACRDYKMMLKGNKGKYEL